MKNKVANVPNCVNEFLLKFVGVIFVLSSILKWIGLRSFAYTVNDFCGLLGYDILYGQGLTLAVVICTMELLLGVIAFVPRLSRIAIWLYLPVMCYFTYITYVNVVSLYGQIESCGCFGEVIHFTPAESFYKNVLLLGLSLVVCALSLCEHKYRRESADEMEEN